MRKITFTFLCLLSLAALTHAQSLQDEMKALGWSSQNLGLQFFWPISRSLPKVESLLADPFELPKTTREWLLKIQPKNSLSDLFAPSAEILAQSVISQEDGIIPPEDEIDRSLKGLPSEELRGILKLLIAQTLVAESFLKQSFSDLSTEEQEAVLKYYGVPTRLANYQFSDPVLGQSSESTEFKKKVFQILDRYHPDARLRAESIVSRVWDKIDPQLQKYFNNPLPKDYDLNTPWGKILVLSANDHRSSLKDLKNVWILLDAGGANSYEGSIGRDLKNKITWWVDNGSEVSYKYVTGEKDIASGIFSGAVVAWINSKGYFTVQSGEFSQGVGICGFGTFLARGRGQFFGKRYVQGCGAYGTGIFSLRNASRSHIEAELYGQGVGFTQGVGVFSIEADQTKIFGGLTEPDPREPMGRTSLCQGVGYGPREFAAGGVGLAAVWGNKNQVEGSYFAQGAGYWHALGGFLIIGEENILRARRYDQGSGVHEAAGYFSAQGNKNTIENWGVGPAFGWDRAIGWAEIIGNENTLSTDWGAASAAMNSSRSFFSVSGNKNRMRLGGLAGGGFSRDQADWAFSKISGEGNVIERDTLLKQSKKNTVLYPSPFSYLMLDSVTFQKDANIAKPQWQNLPQSMGSSIPEAPASVQLQQIGGLNTERQIDAVLELGRKTMLAPQQQKQVLSFLAQLPAQSAGELVKKVDVSDVELFIELRIFLALYGDSISKTLVHEAANEIDPLRRIWLFSFLTQTDLEYSYPVLLQWFNSSDLRVNAAATRILGKLFDRSSHDRVGMRRAWESLHDAVSGPLLTGGKSEKLAGDLALMNFIDAAQLVSSALGTSPQLRQYMINNSPDDLTAQLGAQSAKAWAKYIMDQRESLHNSVQNRLEKDLAVEEKILAKLKEKLILLQQDQSNSNKKDLLHVALLETLGKMRLETVEPKIFLASFRSDNWKVRLAALAALVRVERGRAETLKKVWDRNSDLRVWIVRALPVAEGSVCEPILELAFSDSNAQVRDVARSVLEQLPPSDWGNIPAHWRKKFSSLTSETIQFFSSQE